MLTNYAPNARYDKKGRFSMAKHVEQIQCSLCKRIINVTSQYDVPIQDPVTGFALCKNCIREVARFLDAHDEEEQQHEQEEFAGKLDKILEKNKPHYIKKYLDEYIVNQDHAKKILAVAVYNHYKRMKYGY